MHYDNIIKRFILRKDFFKRAKGRLNGIKRHHSKNEFDDIQFLYELINRKPDVIFDCGANIGFVSHQFLAKFPDSRIYAFEPNPSVFEKLNNQYANNKNVACFNIGISNEQGELMFNVNQNNGTSSFLNPTDYHTSNIASKNITPTKVAVSSINAIMAKTGVKHIDVLKLDIEGFEIKALEGISDLNENVSMIFTEVNLIPTYEGQPLIEDLISYLRPRGFSIYNFYGINENAHRQASITNLLFISSKFKNELIAKGFSKSFNY